MKRPPADEVHYEMFEQCAAVCASKSPNLTRDIEQVTCPDCTRIRKERLEQAVKALKRCGK